MDYDLLTSRKEEIALRARDNIGDVCERFGARDAGSDGEREASEYYAERLKNASDDVKTETFSVSPAAHYGWAHIVATVAILALVSYFFSAMVSLLLSLIGIAVYLVRFGMNKHFFDPLYTSKKSQNVTAMKNPSGEIKNRVFFVAHVDACKEWTINYRMGSVALGCAIIASFVGLVYVAILDIVRWVLVGGLGASIASGAMLIAGFVAIVFAPCWIALYFNVNNKRVIDGANEDLSGCEVALGVLEALNDNRLANTQVGVILTGSSTVGQMGAEAWCDTHKGEFCDVTTTFICLNTLRETEALRVNTKEHNGMVKNDQAVVDVILKTDSSLQNGSLLLGVTDSATFSKHGFKSASITGYNQKCPQYLHTRYDSRDNVNEKCLAKAYSIAIGVLKEIDGQDN